MGPTQVQEEGTWTLVLCGKSIKEFVAILNLPQWLWGLNVLVHIKHLEQFQHEASCFFNARLLSML